MTTEAARVPLIWHSAGGPRIGDETDPSSKEIQATLRVRGGLRCEASCGAARGSKHEALALRGDQHRVFPARRTPAEHPDLSQVLGRGARLF